MKSHLPYSPPPTLPSLTAPSRWKAGQCTGTTGNKCLYRHYYLERDAAAPAVAAFRPPLAEVREAVACTLLTPLQVQPADFSSPLVCKVRKETLQHRREEVGDSRDNSIFIVHFSSWLTRSPGGY